MTYTPSSIMADENFIEQDIIDILKKSFSENAALIKPFPEDPQYEDGVLDYVMTHPKCEILVDCDNIDFGQGTLAEQDGDVGIEITVFARNVRGEDGARNICSLVRQSLTGNIVAGSRIISNDQRKIYYDKNNVWCYGQHYTLNTIFPFGYEEEE